MYKKNIVVLFVVLITMQFIIGSGFALFYFNSTPSEDEKQNTNISIENDVELGVITLLANENSDKKENELDYETQLFLNNDSVYFIRSDNLTQKRSFILDYTLPQDLSKISTNYTISLNCEIKIIDNDLRGVKIEKENKSSNEIKYIYSNSILDYVVPANIIFGKSSNSKNFKLKSGNETTNTEIYTCEIYEDILSLEQNEIKNPIYIDMIYKNYILNDNGDIYEGSMSPASLSSNIEEYKKVIEKANLSKNNSKIEIKFKLKLRNVGN